MARGMVTVGFRFTLTIPVFDASRIEMRLLSETRSVFEYLPTLSAYVHEMRGDKRSDNLTVFRERPFFRGGDPETKWQAVRNIPSYG
jgi:hypothetical protein